MVNLLHICNWSDLFCWNSQIDTNTGLYCCTSSLFLAHNHWLRS